MAKTIGALPEARPIVGFAYAQPTFQVIKQARYAAIDRSPVDAVTSNHFLLAGWSGLLSGHRYIAH